jgi:hypothetical protein
MPTSRSYPAEAFYICVHNRPPSILRAERVHPFERVTHSRVKTVTRWGAGSVELVKETS